MKTITEYYHDLVIGWMSTSKWLRPGNNYVPMMHKRFTIVDEPATSGAYREVCLVHPNKDTVVGVVCLDNVGRDRYFTVLVAGESIKTHVRNLSEIDLLQTKITNYVNKLADEIGDLGEFKRIKAKQVIETPPSDGPYR